MKPTLVLLSSYPRSGNTWLRLVLENLARGSEEAVSINGIREMRGIAANTKLFDAYSPWPAGELTTSQIYALAPSVYAEYSRSSTEAKYLKTHSMALRNTSGEYFFPPAAVRSVLLLVRHPFDVAVSLAHHLGKSFEEAVEIMCRPGFTMSRSRDSSWSNIPEQYGSWAEHTMSWVRRPTPYRIACARYEDLLRGPHAGFGRLADAAGLPFSAQAIDQAVAFTSFERLQNEERSHGFAERPEMSQSFFRAGKEGGWRGVLADSLCRKLADHCGQAMDRLGYGARGEVLPAPREFAGATARALRPPVADPCGSAALR